MPREHGEGGVCDSRLSATAGPVVGRDYLHRLRLVADALVQVGSGWSYVRASNRARVVADREPVLGSGSGHLAAEWTDAWAPIVTAALAEADAPETLVLDHTDFWWTNARTKQRRREFAVLVAYGDPADGAADPRPRVWGLRAAATVQSSDWVELLTSMNLPGATANVITDDNLAVPAAVRMTWSANATDAGAGPFVFLCEHHLREGAVTALEKDRVSHFGSRHLEALNDAFRNPDGWAKFVTGIGQKQPATQAWIAMVGQRVAAQVAARATLPAHYTTAGAEAAAADLKSMLEKRSFSLRNKDRTNRLLRLVRLHLAGLDDGARYHHALRAAAEQTGGHGPRQAQNRDPRLAPTLR